MKSSMIKSDVRSQPGQTRNKQNENPFLHHLSLSLEKVLLIHKIRSSNIGFKAGLHPACNQLSFLVQGPAMTGTAARKNWYNARQIAHKDDRNYQKLPGSDGQ
jgi:hypothetical protein